MAVAFPRYDWIVAIVSIALCFSAFGNGANDVANSFATVVAARTLTMAQAGCVSLFTEFGGATVLGARVTSTIKNGKSNTSRLARPPLWSPWAARKLQVLLLVLALEPRPPSPGNGRTGACRRLQHLGFSYMFFMPYLHRVTVINDPRMRPWHIPLGPSFGKRTLRSTSPKVDVVSAHGGLARRPRVQRVEDNQGPPRCQLTWTVGFLL